MRLDGDRFVRAYDFGAVRVDVDLLILDDMLRLVAANGLRIVDVDLVRSAVVDCRRLIVLDDGVHVVLAVDEHPLLAGAVVHRQLVEAAPLVRVRLDPAQHGTRREAEGRRLFRVVDAAGDDRLIGIAFEEIDDHFLTDARRGNGSPTFTGPRMRDADPAGAVLVLLPVAVPVELHLHAAVLVGIDLVAGRTDDHRGLRTLDERLRRRAPRPELLAARHRDERAAILAAAPAGPRQRLVVAEPQIVICGDRQVLAVLVV